MTLHVPLAEASARTHRNHPAVQQVVQGPLNSLGTAQETELKFTVPTPSKIGKNHLANLGGSSESLTQSHVL
jgi:hypothetical protein